MAIFTAKASQAVGRISWALLLLEALLRLGLFRFLWRACWFVQASTGYSVNVGFVLTTRLRLRLRILGQLGIHIAMP